MKGMLNVFEDLGKLIDFLAIEYENVSVKWNEIYTNNKFNLKKRLVSDIRDDAYIFDEIIEYRTYIGKESFEFLTKLVSMEFVSSEVTFRVKTQNSIEYKIDNYIRNYENGKIPIRKCLNDLFGIRIILWGDFKHSDVKEYMRNYYPLYKCIDSAKQDYIASHIYFENGNYNFPWELQVWCYENMQSNFESHKEYKQDYTRWERENRRCGI